MKVRQLVLLFIGLAIGFASVAQQILVPPYLQPGNVSTLVKEKKVLIWQTDSVQAKFIVEYGLGPQVEGIEKLSTAKISSTQLKLNKKTTFLYRAELSGLKFDEDYSYRVSLNGKPVATSTFSTRTKKPQTRFAVFGDCGARTQQQAEIAYQVYNQKPQFVLVVGDIVYSHGLESEYRRNFFPYYLAQEANPLNGAPLMNSIPFYMLVGNHDVPAANFDKSSDGLAYFYYNDLPLNAPQTEFTIELSGNPDLIKTFQKNTGSRFPRMANFSFDYGNVHIACLDSNPYANPKDPSLVSWLTEDMENSRADWKLVAFHHPGINTSKAHYDDQQMRLLAPVMEKLKVDMVLAGHVHNYQRSLPLMFKPKIDSTGTRYVVTPEGRVDGAFTLDQQFDGVTNIRPKGIIYIVTGAGGAALYDPALSGKPDLWTHPFQENWVPFTAKLISDTHSFTLIETDGKKLTLKQLDAKGNNIDGITITK